MMASKQQMQRASKQLPPIVSCTGGLPIYFLTGKLHFYQTLFCAYSLLKVTAEKIQFILVDDGTLNHNLINQIKNQMPNVKLVLKGEIEKNINSTLPKSEYPYLHHKRKVYPHIKKLTDIHTIDNNAFKLVLDSDMLFWSEPTELINWLKNPNGCLYMLDCEEAYGYKRDLMESLCGFKVPRSMNVGIIGFNSSIINWKDIELWNKTLEEKQGTSYFLEQALSAMIVANLDKTILSDKKYIVNPKKDAVKTANGILHHYVDLSKAHYFKYAWSKIYRNV